MGRGLAVCFEFRATCAVVLNPHRLKERCSALRQIRPVLTERLTPPARRCPQKGLTAADYGDEAVNTAISQYTRTKEAA